MRGDFQGRKYLTEMIVPVVILVAFLLGHIGGEFSFNMMSRVFVGLAIGLLTNNRENSGRIFCIMVVVQCAGNTCVDIIKGGIT